MSDNGTVTFTYGPHLIHVTDEVYNTIIAKINTLPEINNRTIGLVLYGFELITGEQLEEVSGPGDAMEDLLKIC